MDPETDLPAGGGDFGSGATNATGGSGGTSTQPPPETEVEESYTAPVVTGHWIWSANPLSGKVALINARTMDVTTADADAVLKRRADQDLPIVAFALFGQRSSQAYAVLDDSDVRSPKDFEGKVVGYKLYPTPDYLAMLEHAGVDRSRIDEVSVGFDPRILAERKVDVYPVFTSNEPDLLRRVGVPTRLFDPADYGVPTLGLTYITRRELVEQQPDLLARFLNAAMIGTEAARQNPEAATDMVMHYAPEEDRAHQLAMLQAEIELGVGPGSPPWSGLSTRDQWQRLQDTLLQQGGLERPVDVDTAFTNAIAIRVATRVGDPRLAGH